MAARVHEHQAKGLLRAAGVDVPRGEAADSPQEARDAAQRLGGRVVVKALVLANRRAKSGGVVFADDPEEAAQAAEGLIGANVAGSDVERVLVEERLEIERELFLSFAIDEDRRRAVALASLAGGVDVEDALAEGSSVLRRLELDPWQRDLAHRFRKLWASAGLRGPELLPVAELTERAARVFFTHDAELLELNPVALVQDRAVAVGAVLGLDGPALARHPELQESARSDLGQGRPATPLERAAEAVAAAEPYRGTARYIELDGDIALLVGGGGGSLLFFDAVRRAGGRPACYTEIGGNPSAEKVRGLTRVVLQGAGVRGLLVGHNITSNTQVDLIAQGVVAALADEELDPALFPVVAREVGTNDEKGRAIFEASGIEYHGEESTMEAAARRIVELVGGPPA
jgi:succinyl-CoA synthetase beta subunit/citryl-CoA synthetase large subunit